MSDLDGVVVTGGQDLEVRLDDLAAAAAVLADVGAELVAVAAGAAHALAGADLVASAVLDPGGAADVAVAVGGALAGPGGLLARAVAVEAHAGRLLVAAARYRAADVLEEPVRDLRRWVQGTLGAVAMPALLVGGVAWWTARAASGGDPAADVEALLQAHPGVVDEVAGSLPAALSTVATVLLGPAALPADAAVRGRTGTGLLPRSLADSAALLALLYDDGRAGVQQVGRAPAAPVGGLGGLVGLLADVDDRARGARQGEVVVVRREVPVAGGGSTWSAVALLPGTKDWQPDPRRRPHLNDLATNLDLVAGAPAARVEGVRQALVQAGVRPGEPVLLVGHSQGGMVAVRAAAELRGTVDVTHVLTLGSPVASMPVPDGVSVLSLENRGDLVPRLDGAANDAGRAEQVTVVFDAPTSGLREEHDLRDAYLPAAQALAGSDEPAVRGWLDSAAPFLAPAGTGTATTFRVTNAD